MIKDPITLERLAAEHWCRPGENMLWRVGPRTGHLAFDLAGRRGAPHDPADRFRRVSSVEPDWPRPTEVLAAGAFHGDEWVHDPSIWAHVHAADVNALAARCADALVAGGAESWFVQTNQRLAVLIDAAPESTPETSSGEPESGGWLGRAKSVAKSAQSLVEQARATDTLTTLWETHVSTIHRFDSCALGRTLEGVPFGGVSFTDGSRLLVRVDNQVAADSIVEMGSVIFSAR